MIYPLVMIPVTLLSFAWLMHITRKMMKEAQLPVEEQSNKEL